MRRAPGLSFPVHVLEGGARALQNSARTPRSPLARTFPGYLFLPREEAKEKNSRTAKTRRSRWDPAPVVQIRKLRHGEAEGRGSSSGRAARRPWGAPRGRGLLPQPLRQSGAFFVFRGHHDYGFRLARAAPPPLAAGWISPRRGQRGTQQDGGGGERKVALAAPQSAGRPARGPGWPEATQRRTGREPDWPGQAAPIPEDLRSPPGPASVSSPGKWVRCAGQAPRAFRMCRP